MIRLRPLILLFVGSALTLSLIGCGLFGSNSDEGPTLDGDLSWRVEADESVELTVTISRSYYDGSSVNSSTLRSYGLENGSASGDLEDGEYDAYRLQASPFGGGHTPSSVTLQLLNDGEVVKETSETQDGIWMVEVGDFPDTSEQ